MNTIVIVATLILLLAACWTDGRRMEIPNRLTGGFVLAGMVYQWLIGGSGGIIRGLGGLAAGMLPLLILYLLRGLGAGDVKWFAAFGVWAGTDLTLRLVVSSILCAGIIAVLLLIWRIPPFRQWTMSKHWRWPWRTNPALSRGSAKFPFMLAVAPAYALLFWGASGSG